MISGSSPQHGTNKLLIIIIMYKECNVVMLPIKNSWTREEHIQDIKRIILLERKHRDRTHHFVDTIDLEDFIIKHL